MTMYMYNSPLYTCTFSSARTGVLFLSLSNCLCAFLSNACAIYTPLLQLGHQQKYRFQK